MSSIQSPDSVTQLLYGNADTDAAEQQAAKNIRTIPNVPKRALFYSVGGRMFHNAPVDASGNVYPDIPTQQFTPDIQPGRRYGTRWTDPNGREFFQPAGTQDIIPFEQVDGHQNFTQTGPEFHQYDQPEAFTRRGRDTSMDPELQAQDPQLAPEEAPQLLPYTDGPDTQLSRGADMQPQPMPRYAPMQAPAGPPGYAPMQFSDNGAMSSPDMRDFQQQAYRAALMQGLGQQRNPHSLSNFLRHVQADVINPIAGAFDPRARGALQQSTDNIHTQFRQQALQQQQLQAANAQRARQILDSINQNDPNSIQNQRYAADLGLRRQAQDNSGYANQTARYTAQSQDADRQRTADRLDRGEERQGRLADNTIEDSQFNRTMGNSKFIYAQQKDMADRELARQKLEYDLKGKMAAAQQAGDKFAYQKLQDKQKAIDTQRQADQKAQVDMLARASQRDGKGNQVHPELHDIAYGAPVQQPKPVQSNPFEDFFRGVTGQPPAKAQPLPKPKGKPVTASILNAARIIHGNDKQAVMRALQAAGYDVGQ